MPRRRPQPSTPEDLPDPPSDSEKKEYYVAGDKVYFVLRGGSEWRMGSISNKTFSTLMAVVIDDETEDEENVRTEYIRLRRS
ncbi:hypothetical protein RJZ56_007383 [Blastomyces dermatitidis]|uniref:Uncharacterized protein n=1 Tax=Blastomyces gilchristii (strain SLH14081) TaxID=559298 RepID=A0A179UHU8_BLAGS|nr:uncharacterized protein BDBG_02340 [Blastomyces gilchristii SLH14081]OAT06052.1 hypothetical protein BDBG_02340 [Blastomyces gilchristii SLH14081]